MNKKEIAKEIGIRVKAAREKKNMTQQELAELLGYKSKSSVAHIENGRDIPRSMIVKLSNILDVTPAYLMGWEKEPDKSPYKMPVIEETIVFKEVSDHVTAPKRKHPPQTIKTDNNNLKVYEVRSMNKPNDISQKFSSTLVSRTPSGLLLDRRVSKYEMAARSLLPRLNDEGLKKVIDYIDDLVVQEKYTKKG